MKRRSWTSFTRRCQVARTWLAAVACAVAVACSMSAAALADPGEQPIGISEIGFTHDNCWVDCFGLWCTDYCMDGGPRRVVMRVVYPADGERIDPSQPYADENTYEVCDDRSREDEDYIPQGNGGDRDLNWLICKGDVQRLNAVANAPMAEPDPRFGDKFPVIFFSAAIRSYADGYDWLVRRMVMSGFVVVVLGHPQLDYLVRYSEPHPDAAASATWRPHEEVKVYAADAMAALDHLATLNGNDLFGDRLRLGIAEGGVGYMGHSIGGAAATLAANRDPRFRAVVNMDGNINPSTLLELSTTLTAKGLTAPWMMISSAENWPLHYFTVREFFQTMSAGYGFQLAATKHNDFLDGCSDGPYQAQWRDAGFCHKRRPASFEGVVHRYTQAFFLQHLVEDLPQKLLQPGATHLRPVRNFHRWECEPNLESCLAD